MNKSFYTDGACSGNGKKESAGGWAAVEVIACDKGIKTNILSGHKSPTTNNEMELTAVYKALVKAYKEGCKKVTIYCDSAYVVNAITKGWLVNWSRNDWRTKEDKPIKNKLIWKKMYTLLYVKRLNAEFYKVKGHTGDPLNELADKIAVEESMKAK